MNAEARAAKLKELKGWLKKRHNRSRQGAPQWGTRYFYVDDKAGTLSYYKMMYDGVQAAEIGPVPASDC